ncbi:chymotrypsin inhibitor-like [Polistes fuscatus]|uniref:chymotrypsin inhibitor-like n=1 Tax=Polistes fuscatus TaxID=30207 RepID=UPI001CA96AC4|nr:chymotrypsin inhibitor-like [Polistes fuscatus]
MSQFITIFLFLNLLIPYMVFASECGPNGEFNNCGSLCDPTCDNFNQPRQPCVQVCVPKCTCKSPYVLKGSQCVLPSQC